ncbi:TonB-dependent receptor [Brevundimonas sp.]|jgi:outer membrane receptor protein involved in Fe transport|uniref:TonB-dependent receptor plug domain-containing protein n=1 Tax=Brevundimonas sp. TaxID=1871086 RepID=UPI0017AA3E2E|nr:TonB-dependent receptor [Brevundimonas sp.]MBA4807239.1 TonB-dependent receptor [Brevundimonas sp.]
MRLKLLAGASLASLASLAFAGAASAQNSGTSQMPATALEEVIVTGEPAMRNRTDDVVPTLSYDLDYFQRFEPLTAGDALKRVPSVTFLSDVLESDGVRMRGLDSAYTQILINGERVPGANLDRSFFVDRIPAELIERVEVVRSSSANRSGDAVAGAINIVLRDALSLDGGYVRLGALHWNDSQYGEWGGTYGAVWGGQVGPGRLLIGGNIQDRRNPKEKFSQRFDEPGAELNDTEVQSDVRDGTDYSANLSYELPVAGGDLRLSGIFVRTDRVQDENSIEYDEGDINDPAKINANPLDILTDNWSINGRYEREMLGGETTFKLGYATIEDSQFEQEAELDIGDEVIEGERTDTDLTDEEIQAAIEHKIQLGGGMELEFGVQYSDKNRETSIFSAEAEVEDEVTFRALLDSEYEDYEAVAGGVNTIEETRIDPYVMLSGENGPAKWEAGLRYEMTDVSITDETVDDADRVNDKDYGILLPSASIRWKLSDANRITASVARTVRRPNFDYISPAVLEGEYGDNDFIGNPDLEPETAWGVDFGFERRLGRRGVFGVNAFYRDITDLIELTNTGEYSDEAQGNYDDAIDDGATPEEAAEELTSFVLTAENVGDGQVWGIEFDLSTPLDFIGMEHTGVFLNYSWLDSSVDDFMGDRRFNSQSDYVFNVGFTQDIPTWGAAFGATYRKQGDAESRIVGEEVVTTYGADLEVFIEKQVASNVVIRLTGSNLLDSSKDEVFDKFNTIEDQIDRDYDEYELETESAGPWYQIVARMAF